MANGKSAVEGMVLVCIPLLASMVIFLDLLGFQETRPAKITGWRVALLQTTLLVGTWIVVQSELLSLVKALNSLWVSLAWLLVLGVAAFTGWRMALLQAGWRRFRNIPGTLTRAEWLFIAVLGIILSLLLVVAILSPPNNTDSLQYHMSRVVHWAEDQSLAHYASAYEPQILHPIMAEAAILNLRLLWGNDRLANLVQWSSMLLALVGVSVIASMLGSGRHGQMAAVAFATSLPMGILQASSTQNDYVTALWVTSLAVMVIQACRYETGIEVSLFVGVALGLGMVTKGTFYPYAVPFMLWLGFHWLRLRKWGLVLKRSLTIAAIVLILNLGYWVRNIQTFGGPLGPAGWVSTMTSAGGPGSLAARLAENITLNFAPPDQPTTQWMLNTFHQIFQIADPSVKDFQLIWRWNHEDFAGNPLHMVVFVLAILTLLIQMLIKQPFEKIILWYMCALLGSYVALAWIVHYDVYGGRFQLPFFVISAPLVGIACTKIRSRQFTLGAAYFFLLAGLPWVFFNRTRPLIALEKTPGKLAIKPLPYMGTTDIGSILTTSPETILFANWSYLQKPYSRLTQEIQATGCKEVGLRLDSHDIEYALWWLLNAPQNGIRLETLYPMDRLARYVDPTFHPCAILCTICQNRTRLHGLELYMTASDAIQLFMGGTFDPDPDK